MDNESKIPIYMRRAFKAYYERMKVTDEGKQRLKERNEKNKNRKRLKKANDIEFARLSAIDVR